MIAQRATAYVNANISGEAADKRLAQYLRCNPDTAHLLRRGRCWTAERLGEAARAFGKDFIDFVFSDAPAPMRPYQPFAPSPEFQELSARLSRMEARMGVVDGSSDVAARATDQTGGQGGGEVASEGASRPRERRVVGTAGAPAPVRTAAG